MRPILKKAEPRYRSFNHQKRVPVHCLLVIRQHLYQVETRTSPIEALEAVRTNPQKYDLIITDMTMPQMTGYSLSKNLMEIRPGLPVILCTGFSDLVNEEKARSVGILAFLLKPVPLHDLASTMRKVLDETHRKKHS